MFCIFAASALNFLSSCLSTLNLTPFQPNASLIPHSKTEKPWQIVACVYSVELPFLYFHRLPISLYPASYILGKFKVVACVYSVELPFSTFSPPLNFLLRCLMALNPNPRRATNKQLLLSRESWTIEWNMKIENMKNRKLFFPFFMQASIPFSARYCTGYLASALSTGYWAVGTKHWALGTGQ